VPIIWQVSDGEAEVSKNSHGNLSKRERQIMEVLYRQNIATIAEILADLPNPPSYSAARTTTNILERKGYLCHVQKGKSYLYHPVTPRRKAMQEAIRHLISTYFENSLEKAVTAMVRLHGKNLSAEDIARLEKAIRGKRARRAAP
jgi:BlaI family penicillinase repressor